MKKAWEKTFRQKYIILKIFERQILGIEPLAVVLYDRNSNLSPNIIAKNSICHFHLHWVEYLLIFYLIKCRTGHLFFRLFNIYNTEIPSTDTYRATKLSGVTVTMGSYILYRSLALRPRRAVLRHVERPWKTTVDTFEPYMGRFRSETDFFSRTATLNEKLKRIIFICLVISYRMNIILYF